MRTRIKICCIASATEAQLAIEAGTDALGLVTAMPSGPGVIEEARVAEIAAIVPPPIATFLLTSHTDAQSIVRQWRHCHTSAIQLCDRLVPGAHELIRAALPGVRLVQVVHVQDQSAMDEAHQVAPRVDALLLDSGRPDASSKTLGGTGNTHDWSISRQIVQSCGVPVFLAGGQALSITHKSLVRVLRLSQIKARRAGNGNSLAKRCNAELAQPEHSRRASQRPAICGVARSYKGMTIIASVRLAAGRSLTC